MTVEKGRHPHLLYGLVTNLTAINVGVIVRVRPIRSNKAGVTSSCWFASVLLKSDVKDQRSHLAAYEATSSIRS